MNLNIGSSEPKGRYAQRDWVNIDASRVYRGAKGSKGKYPRFAVASGCKLPFKDECFDEIHAIHVLEHVPRDEHAQFLGEVCRTLKPEGSAFIEVPDILRSCELVAGVKAYLTTEHRAQAQEFIRKMIVGFYGKGRHEGDWHHWGFTPWNLEQLLEEAGLVGERQEKMISGHYRQEPVLLYKAWRGA